VNHPVPAGCRVLVTTAVLSMFCVADPWLALRVPWRVLPLPHLRDRWQAFF
jgi:hypothetical protein